MRSTQYHNCVAKLLKQLAETSNTFCILGSYDYRQQSVIKLVDIHCRAPPFSNSVLFISTKSVSLVSD